MTRMEEIHRLIAAELFEEAHARLIEECADPASSAGIEQVASTIAQLNSLLNLVRAQRSQIASQLSQVQLSRGYHGSVPADQPEVDVLG